jgi:hypothetical protein
MKKYKTVSNVKNLIEEVEVERETELCVWVWVTRWGGRELARAAKRSSYENYFDTWDEARDFLRDARQSRLDSARDAVTSAERALAEINALKNPR